VLGEVENRERIARIVTTVATVAYIAGAVIGALLVWHVGGF
jgi:hypothetical protein